MFGLFCVCVKDVHVLRVRCFIVYKEVLDV